MGAGGARVAWDVDVARGRFDAVLDEQDAELVDRIRLIHLMLPDPKGPAPPPELVKEGQVVAVLLNEPPRHQFRLHLPLLDTTGSVFQRPGGVLLGKIRLQFEEQRGRRVHSHWRSSGGF